jgi:hypothetical protein
MRINKGLEGKPTSQQTNFSFVEDFSCPEILEKESYSGYTSEQRKKLQYAIGKCRELGIPLDPKLARFEELDRQVFTEEDNPYKKIH